MRQAIVKLLDGRQGVTRNLDKTFPDLQTQGHFMFPTKDILIRYYQEKRPIGFRNVLRIMPLYEFKCWEVLAYFNEFTITGYVID